MSSELAKRIDGFDAFTNEIEEGNEQAPAPRVIQGELVKFTNDAKWVTRAGDVLPPTLELVAVDVARVVQKWADETPVETIILEAGQKFPNLEKLNESVPKTEWREGPDGNPRGPWQAQHIVYMVDLATMNRFSWPSDINTIGSSRCVSELVDRTKWMRRFRGVNVYPVITLTDTFMPTRFGGRQRPHFEVERWISLGEGGSALPAPELKALPDTAALDTPQGARTVEPLTTKEVVDDDIPY
jgi:hypothetical protein